MATEIKSENLMKGMLSFLQEKDSHMHGMQLQLFDDLPLPPRPTSHSEEVTTSVVEKIVPKVVEWMYHPSESPTQEELEGLKSDLHAAIEWEDDPYRIAKDLERACWDSDGELVDILADVGHYRYEAHKQVVHRDWVLKYGVFSKFVVGDSVIFTHKGKQETGEIIRIDPELAQYTIHCPQHGHVKKGAGTHGHIINFEMCTAV